MEKTKKIVPPVEGDASIKKEIKKDVMAENIEKNKLDKFKEEALNLVKGIAPSIDRRYDYTEVCFAGMAKDIPIAFVRHMTENGVSYGYDVLYLVWKYNGKIKWRELMDTADTKNYLYVSSVEIKDDVISAVVKSSGYAQPTMDRIDIKISELKN